MFSFEVLTEEGRARAGNLVTSHGSIETPSFVPVGTLAAVNPLSTEELLSIGTQAIIANAFHLHLQPGEEIIKEIGGLHRFMGWKRPLITDSGGFQIFSLGAGKETGLGKVASMFTDDRIKRPYANLKKEKSLLRVDEDGINFISYIDGSKHSFTPEHVIKIERKLGADIIMMLDECTSPLHNYQYTKEAMARTHRWSLRALEEFQLSSFNSQALFGIVQGGAYKDLRLESAQFISEQDFNGYAIGGLLGDSKKDMHEVLDWVMPLLKKNRPRHLLGIGEIDDIFEIVSRGIDLFDCIFPTKLAKTGTVFTKRGKRYRIHLLNNRYKDDTRPIDEECNCYTCCNYSKGYIRHLFKIKDPFAVRLAAIHNLSFIESLMRHIRMAIREKRFSAFRREWCRDN
ncbi:MAG: tRNA guanosine(34) transglycosylase Tgt [Thermodesulfobacteriota bacterium]|nr:tRNA guanosine(34) transglycosylase Tgt [Thermodesulfobacteriota bacterium]